MEIVRSIKIEVNHSHWIFLAFLFQANSEQQTQWVCSFRDEAYGGPFRAVRTRARSLSVSNAALLSSLLALILSCLMYAHFLF